MSRAKFLLPLLVAALLLTSCVAGTNADVGVPPPDGGSIAGFWLGLWHGVIAPFTFAVSLFTDAVNVYEVHNNGNWYDFGFVLGAGILFGGGSRARR